LTASLRITHTCNLFICDLSARMSACLLLHVSLCICVHSHMRTHILSQTLSMFDNSTRTSINTQIHVCITCSHCKHPSAYMHACKYILSVSLFLSFSRFLSLPIILSLTHTRTHTHTLTITHTNNHTHMQSIQL